MAEETRDLAVLGFRVDATNATKAIDNLATALGKLDENSKNIDQLLNNKISVILNHASKSSQLVTKAVGALAAFQNLGKFADATKDFAVDMTSVADAITKLNNAKVDTFATKIQKAVDTIKGTASVLKYTIDITNKDVFDNLVNSHIITIDGESVKRINELNSVLNKITNGITAKLVPDKDSLGELQQEVGQGITPEIKFDQKAKTIVQDLYKTINEAIVQRGDRGAIKIPLAFSFGTATSANQELVKEAREKVKKDKAIDAIREGIKDAMKSDKTLKAEWQDENGKSILEQVLEKAVLGSPNAIDKITNAFRQGLDWSEKGINESLDKAEIAKTPYGRLIDRGLADIPADVARYLNGMEAKLVEATKGIKEAVTIKPQIVPPTQTAGDAKNYVGGLTELVKDVKLPPTKKVTVEAPKVVIDTKNAEKTINEKNLKVAVDGIKVEPATIWVDKANAEVKLLQVQLVADWPDVVVHPQNLFIDVASIPVEKIKPANGAEELPLTIKKATVTPMSVTVDLANIAKDAVKVAGKKVAISPQSITLDVPQAITKNSILRLAKPLGVSADMIVKPNKLSVPDDYVGKLDKPISVTAKINIDPLPSDEIEKMGLLVTQINNVDVAYGQLLGTVRTLRDTIRETETAMSQELRGLIKGEQHKVAAKIKDPEKAAAADAEKIKKQAEAEQAALDALLEAQKQLKDLEEMMQKSPDDKKLQDKVKVYREQIENLRKAVNADPTDDIQKNIDAFTKDVSNATTNFKAHLDSVNKTLVDNNKNWSAQADSIKKNAQGYAAMNALTGKAVATTAAMNVQLRTSAIETNNLIRVRTQLLTMPDPFVRLKAEIGETNSRLADLGRAFGLYFSGRSIINYFRQASESANNFQYEIRRIQSLATDFDFGELRNGLMDIDARFGNVIHNSQALYWAFSSGVRGTEKELVKFTETMSKTATAIKADVMPTLDAATSVMNAWGLSASSAAEIGDLLFGIVKYGKSNAQQLTTSLGHVVAPAAALNIELNELGAAAATLTKTMKTNRAFTYLSNILGKMASPTKAVQEAAAELGVELSASAIKARGFANTLKDIREATGGDIGKIAKLFPDLRGQRAAITLLSTQYKDFEQQLDNMRNKAGSMEEALSKITDTPEAQIKALKNTFSMLSIEAGNTVNSMLTLGGALGPILKGLNDLGHNGRTILGNLAAAGAAWGGMAVTAKAFAVAQYAALQTSYQMAMSSAEIKRNEMDAALLKEKQALEANKLLVADMKAQVAAKLNNDEQLRMLNAQKDAVNERLRLAAAQVNQERLALKIQNEYVKRQVTDTLLPNISASKSRIVELRSVLAEVTKVGDGTQETLELKRIKNLNLIKRLQSDISIQETKNNAVIKNFMNEYDEEIKGFVMQNEELRKLMHTLRGEGNVKAYLDAKNTVDTIVNTIKKSDVLANQVAQYGLKDDDLQILAKKLLYEQMRKDVQSGELFSQEMLIKLLKDEIAQEDIHLQQLEAQKRSILEKTTLTKEDQAQLDKLTQAESVAAAESRQMLDIVTQIERRTDETTGRMRQQIAVIGEAVKVAKEKLDQDTQEAEVIRKNLEMSLKQATFIGKETLAATQSAMDAHMEYQSMLMQENELQSEIDRIVDRKGNLIDDSADAQERLNVLLEKQKKLQLDAAAAQERFTRAGILAGNQNAVQTKINQFNALPKVDQTFWRRQKLVNDIQLNPKVASEMMRAMAKEMGGMGLASMFGGNAMRVATMGMSFMPGMQKWALPLTMASQFNVVGKAQKGFAMLTGTMVKMLGSTQKLQSKGFMVLDKNMVDLTKTIIQNISWTKKQALANKALMAMSTGGQQANAAIAGQAALISGLTAGIGVAIIAAIAGSLWWALSKTEKGGPLGDVMEKLFVIEDLKRYSELLDARRERMQTERETHESMVRETQRMLKIQEEQNSTIKRSLVWQRETNALRQALIDLSVYDEIQMKELELFNKRAKRQRMQEQRKGVLGAMQSSPFAALELNKLDAEMPSKAEIDELANATKELYRKYWAGVGETAYQQLRESLEADRDAAFTPMMDANGKMDLANKMATMAEKRLSSLLGYDDETLDLTMKSSLQIREMIRKRIAELKKSAEDAHIALEDAKEQANMYAEGSPERTKADETVKQLELAYEAAAKKIDDDTTNISNAFRDYYNKIANKANAFVEQLKENSGNQQKMAKFNALFTQNDESFNVLGDTIVDYWDAMNKLRTDYANKAGVFKGMDADAAQIAFKDALKKLGDQQIQNITTNVNNIKQMQDNLTRFMETQANDMRQLSKQQFEYNMSNPALAGMRPQMIKNRMKELNSIMQPIIQQRDAAFMKAQELMNQPGQMARAQESLEEAYKYEGQVKGLAMEELELVKKRADIERGINQSMYQLASTLQGKFESTAQTAVDAYSVESIRLQMRQIGENIAPPIQTNAQEIERKLTAQLFQRSIDNYNLLQQASLRLQQQISNQAQNADKMGNAATVIQKASDTAKVAAETFKRTVESNRTTFRVKRI